MKPYVLVVEDEDSLSTLLQYNFEKEGFEVGVANDGEQALIMIEERTPDVLLLDWMLPKLSGIEVCRSLRRSKEKKKIPIIMLTARGDETDRITGLDSELTITFSNLSLCLYYSPERELCSEEQTPP